jgi:hypothetical protein
MLARQMGQVFGNKYMQRFLDSSSTPAIQREANEPYGQSTEFGSFDIYPDNFVGPLPVSDRNADTWPIRESEFQTLQTHLSSVRDGSGKIAVTGTNSFKMQVYLDLGWLMTSGAGQELVQDLQSASHSVTITEETSGGNATGYSPDEDSFELPMSPPTAGPGANVTISYNPSILFIGSGTQPWHHRPPAIGLAHEMVHAWTGVNGMRARLVDPATGTNRRELQATGLGEFAQARLTENRFRAEFGLPTRPVY